ncbi:MAG: glycosyltransferase [Candidatus Limnocylindria bacterium]
MPAESPPPEVRALLEERAMARDARDWPTADALRERIVALGWEPQDAAGGSTARPVLPAQAEELDSLLAEPSSVAVSVQLLAEDHPDDLSRFLRGLASHAPAVTWELVIVANEPSYDLDPLMNAALPSGPASVMHTSARLGWADARTLGMRRSRGEVTILLDTSLEPTGDFVTPLLAAFDDPSVGLAGGWGVVSGDARDFIEAPPGEVDAIEAYCMAVRRAALAAVGGFDPRFRFYRNADLDFSFAVRDAGWRAVRTDPLPFERHEHRGWASLPDDERDRLSKRNFYRFLRRWGNRPDLLLEPGTDR